MNTKIKQVCKEFLSDKNNRIFLILYIALPFVLNIIIESFSRKNVLGGFVFLFTKPYAFICDMLIIMLTMSVVFLVRRRIFWLSLMSVIWILLGFFNYVLLSNRVTPFTAEDIKSLSDVSGVINKYFDHKQIVMAVIALIVIVLILAAVFFLGPKLEKRVDFLNFLKGLGLIFIVYLLMMCWIVAGIQIGQIEAKFGELSKSYLKNGFAYCFSNSLINTGIKKPSNYSEEKIAEITDEEDDKEVAEPTPQPENQEQIETPNIVIVQLESFFDINNVQGLEFSKNPIPNFTNLMAQNPSGYFSVPIVGAGTVNAEFEVMTGMNLNDFGPGEYPFKTIMRNTTCESMAYNLKEHGYTAQFVHNNTGRFYGRNQVYANLGFDTFTSVEYMQVENRTPMGWAKDYYLTNQIMQSLEYTPEQDLVYAISVQGHGSYPPEEKYKHYVSITDIDEKYEDIKGSLEYYANQLYEIDGFVGKLVEKLSNLDEDTILVMYGDHLPSFNFADEDLKNGSIYQTSYFIWNNMELDYSNQDIEAYELSSILLEKLGITDGVINQYHQKNRGVLEEEDYLNGLQNLEYDILYGDKIVYDGVNPYETTQMQMGIKPIEITEVLPAPEDMEAETEEDDVEDSGKQRYLVKGTNFTRYSRVYINEEKYKTTWIDPHTLMFSAGELADGTSVTVWQSALSCTDEYIYHTGENTEAANAATDGAVTSKGRKTDG